MNIISLFFQEVLCRPLFNLLILLYNIIPGHDFGLAIILSTIIIKILLIPSSRSAIRSQKDLTELQPKIKEIQEKYKSDKEKQGLALMELYKAHKINPFGGFLTLLVQIPILIALYRVFWTGLDPDKLNGLYSFIRHPGVINPFFLGIIDLSKASPILAVLAGISQFIQTRMMTPKLKKIDHKADTMSLVNQQMLYMMPFLTIIIVWKLPGGLPLYWTVITLFSIIQQYFVLKKRNESGTQKNN